MNAKINPISLLACIGSGIGLAIIATVASFLSAFVFQGDSLSAIIFILIYPLSFLAAKVFGSGPDSVGFFLLYSLQYIAYGLVVYIIGLRLDVKRGIWVCVYTHLIAAFVMTIIWLIN